MFRKARQVLKGSAPKRVRTNWNMRLNDRDRERIQARADKYACGDMSKWMRYAAKHFVPGEADLVPLGR